MLVRIEKLVSFDGWRAGVRPTQGAGVHMPLGVFRGDCHDAVDGIDRVQDETKLRLSAAAGVSFSSPLLQKLFVFICSGCRDKD